MKLSILQLKISSIILHGQVFVLMVRQKHRTHIKKDTRRIYGNHPELADEWHTQDFSMDIDNITIRARLFKINDIIS